MASLPSGYLLPACQFLSGISCSTVEVLPIYHICIQASLWFLRPCSAIGQPPKSSIELPEQVEDDPTGGKFAGAGGLLNGAPNKLDDIISFHVGDLVTALQRAALQPGGQEVLIYATIMGSIGVPQMYVQILEFI